MQSVQVTKLIGTGFGLGLALYLAINLTLHINNASQLTMPPIGYMLITFISGAALMLLWCEKDGLLSGERKWLLLNLFILAGGICFLCVNDDTRIVDHLEQESFQGQCAYDHLYDLNSNDTEKEETWVKLLNSPWQCVASYYG